MRVRRWTAALLAALAMSGCGTGKDPTLRPGPAPTSTVPLPQLGDVQAAIRRGLSSLQSYRAEVVVTRSTLPGDSRLTVEWTARGVAKETERDPENERVFFYDGREGRRVVYNAPAGGRGAPNARVETGIPAGLPGPPPTRHPVRPDPVALAREILELADARVDREIVEGRTVWVVQRSRPGDRPDLHVFTIDEQTGLALRVDALHAGQPEYQVRVENLTANIDAEPAFRIPDGVRVSTTDRGFVRTSIADVRRVAGFAPAFPTWLPPGFTPEGLDVTPGVASPVQPVAPRGVSAAFQRGMDVLLIIITPQPVVPPPPGRPGPAPRDDEGGRADPVRFERITLNGGAFAGAEAERSVNGNLGRTYLKVANDAQVLSASGDITPEDMLRLAESLQPVR